MRFHGKRPGTEGILCLSIPLNRTFHYLNRIVHSLNNFSAEILFFTQKNYKRGLFSTRGRPTRLSCPKRRFTQKYFTFFKKNVAFSPIIIGLFNTRGTDHQDCIGVKMKYMPIRAINADHCFYRGTGTMPETAFPASPFFFRG